MRKRLTPLCRKRQKGSTTTAAGPATAPPRQAQAWTDAWRTLAVQVKERLAPAGVVVWGEDHGPAVAAFRDVGIGAQAAENAEAGLPPRGRPSPVAEAGAAVPSPPAPGSRIRGELHLWVLPEGNLLGSDAEQALAGMTRLAENILFCCVEAGVPGDDSIGGCPPEHWVISFECRGYSLELNWEATFFGFPLFLFRRRRHLHHVAVRPLRVLVLSSVLDNACGEVRLLRPLQYLQRDGLIEARAFQDSKKRPPSLAELDWADILVLQRIKSRTWRPFVRHAERRGIPIIYEIDDNLLELPVSHPEAKNALGQRIKNAKYAWFLRRAQAITTSTRSLAAYLRRFDRPVYLLRNYIDEPASPERQAAGPDPAGRRVPVIGYAGSTTHASDFDVVRGALLEVSSRFQNRVRLRFRGYAPPELANAANVSVEHGLLPYDEYLRELAGSRLDLAIAPLLDNPFNACKSNLKFLEYAIAGIPGIYSPVGPYRDSVHHGVTGILVRDNSEDQWLKTLLAVVEDPDGLESLGGKARAYVREHYRLQDHYREWWDTYVEILLGSAHRCL